MQTQQVSEPPKGLRNFLLKYKLNLLSNEFDKAQFNNKWHDEIYATRREDPFKRYRTNIPIIKDPYPVCTWKSNIMPAVGVVEPNAIVPVTTPPKKNTNLVNDLETQVSDLSFAVGILSLVNVGLLFTHLIR